MRKITSDNLQILFQHLIKKLDRDGINEIEIDQDLYRFIPTDEWNSFEDNVISGSLYDDFDSLKNILDDDDRIFTYVDFDRLASILRYISEKMNPVER